MKRRIISLITAFTLIFSSYAFAFSTDSYNRDLRVGLKIMLSPNLKITFNGDYLQDDKTIKSGTSLDLTYVNSRVAINGVEYDEITFKPFDGKNTITIVNGAKSYNYLGTMVFKPTGEGILPINIINVEDYLKGVIGYEMSNSYPIEALKAQAVCARNYAMISLGKHSSEGFDLCDGTHCQVYRGYNPSYGNVIKAVEETKGMFLIYNGSFVGCYYSASNGGYTESSKNPWGSNVPYLIVKKDDYDNEVWPSDKKFTSAEISTILKNKEYLAQGDTFLRIDIDNIERYENVRISRLYIIYKDINGAENTLIIKGERVRTFLNLRSSYYNIAYDSGSDTYIFSGRGYGHGIGLSQIGAKNRAYAGIKFEDILRFYYNGSNIESAAQKTITLTQDSNRIILGNEIKLNTSITGTSDTYIYKYVFKIGDQIVHTVDYSSAAAFVFKPEKPGNYSVFMYAKTANSQNAYDEFKTSTFSVLEAPTLENIKASPSEAFVNKPVSITADVKGGSGTGSQYIVELKLGDKLIETKAIDKPSYSFTPKQAGQYKVVIKVKDKLSKKDYDRLYEIRVDVKQQVLFSLNRTLKRGMSGSDVSKLQSALKQLGNYTYGRITTYYGSITEAAVKSFQRSKGLRQTGVTDKATADAINKALIAKATPTTPTAPSTEVKFSLSRTLKRGMSGSDVSKLQSALKQLGNYTYGRITTYYGSITEAAVKSFQRSKGLRQTGVTDKATADAINKALIAKATPTTPTKPAAPSTEVKFSLSRTLKRGMSGSDVSKLQSALKQLGNYTYGRITTYYGSITEAAVKSFQRSKGLRQTGVTDKATADAINKALIAKATPTTPTTPTKPTAPSTEVKFSLSRTLKRGMSGSDVSKLQSALKQLGNYTYGRITTYYGSITEAAVKSFQRSKGLRQTGVTDKATADAINKALIAKAGAKTSSTTVKRFAPARILCVGKSGSDVATLQNILRKLGHYTYKTTGYYGSITKNAVKSFQRRYGIITTGVTASLTVKKINELLG